MAPLIVAANHQNGLIDPMLLLVPALVALAMALQQKRWLHLSGALGLALLVGAFLAGVALLLSADLGSDGFSTLVNGFAVFCASR